MASSGYIDDPLHGRKARGHDKLAVTGTVQSLPAALVADLEGGPPSIAYLSVTSGNAHLAFHDDEYDPAAGDLGHLLAAGDHITITGKTNVRNIRLTDDGGTDAVVQVTVG